MKAKKSEKSRDRLILKYFTIATVDAIATGLENIDTDDLFLSIYIKSVDKDIEYFIHEFEKQLLLSKINYLKFKNGLHQFYLDMAEYIKHNSLYSKLFELAYLSYVVFCKNKIQWEILSSYQNLIIQLYPYLSGSSSKIACGIDAKGKLIIIPELYAYLTEINYELYLMAAKNNDVTPEEMIKLFNKYHYHVKTTNQCHQIIVNDQISTTMLYLMAYFINDETREIIAKTYRKAMDLVESNSLFVNNKCSDLIKEKLIHRQYLLPAEGITALFVNNGQVSKLLLKEVIKSETVVLLFRLKFKDGSYTSGYYNSNEAVFYNMWKESSHSSITHIPIENIVLQNYLNLTCMLSNDERNELFWFKEVKSLKEIINTTNEVLVYYEIKESIKGTKGQVVSRHFDKSKYIAELMNIKPFLRRLPVGSSAGEVAIETAKKLGIDLPENYTFVRGFLKQVYKSE